jgi:hypothetical protein
MNLYLLIPHPRAEADYDSCVVCAESVEEAKTYHPGGRLRWVNGAWNDPKYGPQKDFAWATPEWLNAQLLGVADSMVDVGVVCAAPK